MKTLKLTILMLAAMFLLTGVNNIYADTSDQHDQHHGMTDQAYKNSKNSSEEIHIVVDREAPAMDEKKQCAAKATVIEMADGFGITFTDKSARFQNAVSVPERLQQAC